MKLLASGDQVGSYRVIGSHPGGGHRAIHVETHERVHLGISQSEDWREGAVRGLRVAAAIAGLRHPGVARIIGRGALPDRRLWTASSLAEGVTLGEVLGRRRLAVDETVSLVRDVAEILVASARAGIVHGRVRPEVIVLRTGERDYPIQLGGWVDASAPGIDAARHEPTRYAAPETHDDVACDARADVYSLGVIAYRGLTGRFPGAVTPELVAGVPGHVGALVVRMLAADPSVRPTAADVLATASALDGDRVLSGPRFARPRWTPQPRDLDAERQRLLSVVDLADARKQRD